MKNKIKSLLKTYFITGLLVLLPLALTFWILNALLRNMEALIGDPIQQYLEIYIPGMGIMLLICLILLVGIFARNLIGRKLGHLGEMILNKIPLVRNIYTSIKQLINTLFLQGKDNFRGVVMVEYPRLGTYSLGFITGESRGEVQRITNEIIVNVFIPTTPNPTSGFLLLFPEKDIIHLHMTVEEGLKMIISGGMITPPDREVALPPGSKR
ncbi:MAG: hypothetical protein CO150_04685 [Nitrospirae bacterium CG_4_9_14_3_um_filter_53_35]|nr:MAG: hypothetical protein AUK29_06610 [Nitrospirae bacterium CG2_30_53_67]PIS36622.1 MAG: hypothetical protein COT35_10060 [Nitrospirae bacterium CG08_land_8_20_14_0_20_52_24]PIV85640.1 MAG: hypothetical protein COW52_01055 [Nitrospirae bacterium CG17_big_fil_post_rev_8_21_14_2_50_50_9]PIW84412.1 MAG: hypothetical protein COZ95_09995 [Nitrospirae bacterium CG_4_8_14_3_um_filter_50_41]PIX86689.1 MAG: hypothetical protein COZ32_01915 [Nitrospirae bacterium CG_4_10_14_3_um_filter_53_41]PJA7541